MKIAYLKYDDYSSTIVFDVSIDNTCKGCLLSDRFEDCVCNSNTGYKKYHKLLDATSEIVRFQGLPCTIADSNSDIPYIVIKIYELELSIYLSKYIYKKYENKSSEGN